MFSITLDSLTMAHLAECADGQAALAIPSRSFLPQPVPTTLVQDGGCWHVPRKGSVWIRLTIF